MAAAARGHLGGLVALLSPGAGDVVVELNLNWCDSNGNPALTAAILNGR